MHDQRKTMPTLDITLTDVQRQLIVHLGEHTEELNEIIAQQVKAFCTPENLTAIINKAVQQTLPRAIQDKVETYFRYGKGSQTIQDIVEQTLNPIAPQ